MNPMEEDQEQLKHVCKFCSKSFPCGRSLGGHMRSHVTNVSAETEVKPALTTASKLSFSSLNNNNDGTSSEAGTNGGYGLRQNPKKTRRLTDSSEDTLFTDKFCKECGKGFHSWKALFGHMKCHSEKETVSNNNNNSLDDEDSWTNNNASQQKLVMDSQSDNEATASNRRRRSKRRRTRYMMTPATSSMTSFCANPSSSVSEAEQEQEEVAMSLMMLSRDVGPWGGLSSVAESSNNNSLDLEAPSSVQTNLVSMAEGKRLISNGSELVKVTKPRDKKWEFGNSVSSNLKSQGKSLELLATESPGNGFRMNQTRVSVNGFIKNGKGAEFSKISHRRGKFECTTCNKIFHSYQALGGHRASHKKIKGCFASRNEISENSIEIVADLSPDPTTESKLMKNSDNNEYLVEQELGNGFDHEEVEDTVRESKKSKGQHECPICLKVFSSGQALGGHEISFGWWV